MSVVRMMEKCNQRGLSQHVLCWSSCFIRWLIFCVGPYGSAYEKSVWENITVCPYTHASPVIQQTSHDILASTSHRGPQIAQWCVVIFSSLLSAHSWQSTTPLTLPSSAVFWLPAPAAAAASAMLVSPSSTATRLAICSWLHPATSICAAAGVHVLHTWSLTYVNRHLTIGRNPIFTSGTRDAPKRFKTPFKFHFFFLFSPSTNGKRWSWDKVSDSIC